MPVSPATITLDDSPVEYSILYREPATLSGDMSGWRSTYEFGVLMADHDAFCRFLGGTEVEIDLGGGSSATRVIPCSDPYRADLLCDRISSRATGSYTETNPGPLKNWSHAKVRAEFASVPYPTDGSTPFMEIESDAAPEATTAAGRQLAFPDGTPIASDAAAVYTAGRVAITIHNAINDRAGDEAIDYAFAGTVNNATVLGIYPAYTFRYDGMRRREVKMAGGQIVCAKTMYFGKRAIDWRKLLKGNFAWDFAVKPGGGYIYNAVDYAPLFA